ncbi:hypothetical protein niasHT_026419 [Heterodera trifolii]|uniref:Uncharacterized protein n=1 Tax=Heterodera trifolii TaxID=157864 RepID=A0ABD2JC04_9BILA
MFIKPPTNGEKMIRPRAMAGEREGGNASGAFAGRSFSANHSPGETPPPPAQSFAPRASDTLWRKRFTCKANVRHLRAKVCQNDALARKGHGQMANWGGGGAKRGTIRLEFLSSEIKKDKIGRGRSTKRHSFAFHLF